MLRRLLAITLLLAFGFPLAEQLIAAVPDSDASLPACCRRHGKHHCAMLAGTADSHSPAFQAPTCQSYPAAVTPLSSLTAFIQSPLRTAGKAYPGSASAENRTLPHQILASSAHLTRGPPARLA